MRKLLTGTAIIFMMVLTAGLVSAASASQPTAIYPWSGSGTIYFIDNETGTVTPETGAQITLNQAVTTTGEPQNFYYGFITFTLPGGSTPTNISISAIVGPEDPKAWHISGSSPLLLSAEGRFSHQPQHRGTPTDVRYTFSIRGAMQDIPAFSFQGAFSNGGEPERPFETNAHR
ncbi:MAG: hypothetical protein ABSH41_25270 [Syntrophobacteraceae bacterium]